jgi:hypothetical protein
MSSWGPRLRASIYAIGSDQIAILEWGAAVRLVSLRPLRLIERQDAALPSDQWTYLGAFDHHTHRLEQDARGSRVVRFIGPDEQSECIPTYQDGDFSRFDRGHFARRSCPEFGETTPGPIIAAPPPTPATHPAAPRANPPR